MRGREADHERATKGNAIAELTFEMASTTHRAGRKFCVENPANSYMWMLDSAVELAKQEGVHRVLVSNCMFEGVVATRPRRS